MFKTKAAMKALTIAVLVFAILIAPSVTPAGPAPEKASTMQLSEGSIHVNVTDEAGRPIEGANVTIVGNVTGHMTGSDGSVLITNLNTTLSPYGINASKVGYLNGSAIATVTKNNVTNITVVIEGGEFAGFVYGLDNSPIGNATVEIAIGAQIIQTLSSPNGSFNLTGIPTGTYIAVVFAQYYSATSEVVSVTANVTTHRALPFKLAMSTGRITGYIFDGTVPVPGARVSINIDTIEHTVLSGDIGSFEIPGIPAGNYTVRVSKDGYLDAEKVNVTVENGFDTENVNITLVGKPSKISGSVAAKTTGGSVLLYGALVEALGTGRNATTGTQGLYSITDVPVGTWTIKASAPGYDDNETTVVVVSRGSDITRNILLTPKPGQLMGTVRDANTYDVLEGYRVAISGPLQRETYTNDLGQYVFAGLTPGNYTLTVTGSLTETTHSPYIKYDIEVDPEGVTTEDVSMLLAKQALGGFVFGLDLPHSFMALAFIITMVVLALAVFIRLKRIQRSEKEGIPESELAGEEEDGDKPPTS